ncbi:hypothetical protein [Roseovarius sp.]|uniref:hypothetical protein n=1 Tax=Roseovarius sp. TaxID=1486281 RepID=UPI003BAA78E4
MQGNKIVEATRLNVDEAYQKHGFMLMLMGSSLRTALLVLGFTAAAFLMFYSVGFFSRPPYDLYNFFWPFISLPTIARWARIRKINGESRALLLLSAVALVTFFIVVMVAIGADQGYAYILVLSVLVAFFLSFIPYFKE